MTGPSNVELINRCLGPSSERLRELNLRGRQVRDTNLARVRDLGTLEKLTIWSADDLTDIGLGHLRGIDHLRTIEINDCKLTDACLDRLSAIPSLEELDLRGNFLTGARLDQLARLPRLRLLRLGIKNQIADGAMESLRNIKSLEVLDLAGTNVGDAGLMRLSVLLKLKEISIGRSKITADGVKQFRIGRPDVQIVP